MVDVELERDSIGLPQTDLTESASVSTAESATPPAMLEAQTIPSNSSSHNLSLLSQPLAVKTEPDLSLVKTERVEEEVVEEAMNVVIKEEPMSPPRTVTPVKMVLGGLGTSPARVNSPASGTTTPVKEGAGWTRIQIKSEPNSPRASPVAKKGWQNISMLTSPIKQETPDVGQIKSEPGHNLVSKTVTTDLLQQKPQQTSIVISQDLGQKQDTAVSHSGQAHRFASPNQPKVSQGQVLSGVSGTAVRGSGLVTVQSTGPAASSSASPVMGNTVISSPGNTTPKSSQPTVYIRCHDNQGKVYLIPQHVLNKTSSVGSTIPVASQPRPSHVQRLSTPLGMAIIAPGASTSLQSGQTSSPAIASLVSPQRVGNPRTLISPGVKQQQLVTTAVKGTNKTATLTYVLASTAGAASTQSVVTTVAQSQKLTLPSQAGVGQSILVSSSAQPAGTSLIMNPSPSQGSRPGAPLVQSAARSSSISPASALQVSQGKKITKSVSASNLTENLRIVGGNIIGGSQKGTSFVLVNQPPGGTAVTTKPGGQTQGGVSLLSSLTGLKTAKTKSMETGLTRSVPSVSLLNKPSPSTVRHLSPGTVIIKQEPKMSPVSAIRPGTVAVLAGQGNQQTPLLLVPASPQQIRPNLHQSTVVMASKTPPPPQPKQSLITTVGNQKLIVQLLPPKQAETTAASLVEVKKEKEDFSKIENQQNRIVACKKVKIESEENQLSGFRSVFGKPLLRGPDIE